MDPLLAAEVAAAVGPLDPAATEPDLVLIDADTLGELAPARASELRGRHPRAAVVAVGAEGSSRRIVELLRAGASDWIPRPCDPQLLRARVEAALARRELAQQGRTVQELLERQGRLVEEDRRDLAARIASMGEELERAHAELAGAHRQLRARVAQLALLYRIGRDLSNDRNWDEALGRLLSGLRSFLNARGAGLLLCSQQGRCIAPRRVDGLSPGAVERAQRELLGRAGGGGADVTTIPAEAAPFPLESLAAGRPTPCAQWPSAWDLTVLPLRHREHELGFLLIERSYASAADISDDLHFLTTIQTILAEEVAGAQALFELRRLRGFHERTLDHVGSGIVTLAADGRVVYANRKTRELLEDDGDAGELVRRLRVGGEGVPLLRWLHQMEDGAAAEGWLARVSPDEAPIPVGVRASRLPGEVAGDDHFVAILEDQRATRQLESERRRAARQDELLVMAAEWAHDVRTPLTGILHHAELLFETGADQVTRARHFEVVRGEVDRINGLVSNFLDFARPVRLRCVPVDLRGVAAAAVELMQARAAHREVELTLASAPPARWECNADPDALKQVLLNLIENALDASPAGGAVVLRLTREPATAMGLDVAESAAAVVATIEDEGPGVPPEHLHRLFIPFFTTKSNGNGLGLAISEKIVRGHRGQLRYERHDARTHMRVLLPAAGAQAASTFQEARG